MDTRKGLYTPSAAFCSQLDHWFEEARSFTPTYMRPITLVLFALY